MYLACATRYVSCVKTYSSINCINKHTATRVSGLCLNYILVRRPEKEVVVYTSLLIL